MALEDRGVKKEAFIDLLENAKAKIHFSSDSLGMFIEQLRDHGMGGQYHLAFILDQLNRLGLDFMNGINKTAIGRPFFESLLRYSMNHALCEVKFKARIPVPKSYQLVGVADEGRAYINEGLNEDDVYTLKPGLIYGTFLLGSVGMSAYTMVSSMCASISTRGPCVLEGTLSHFQEPGHPPRNWRVAVSILLKTYCESDLSYSSTCLRCR